jgi:hypothetical protein
MKTQLKALVVGAALALTAASVAEAQPWTSIARREYNLDRRIDVGVRNGSLTRMEAVRLRSELRGLVRLERVYSRGGLNWRERADLNRRFDGLSARIYANRHDWQNRRRY